MGNFYSKKKPPTAHISDTDRIILSLKTQRKKLEDQEKLLQLRLDNYVAVAKTLLADARRDRALLTLKKKKLTENQLVQLHGLIMNVEQLLNNIESTKQSTKLFSVLKEGNEALKTLQSQVKLDDVQKLMDETAEAAEFQRELNAVLGQSLTNEDEDLVCEELDQLERMLQDEERLEMPSAPSVPSAAKREAEKVATRQGLADAADAEKRREADGEASREGVAPLLAA